MNIIKFIKGKFTSTLSSKGRNQVNFHTNKIYHYRIKIKGKNNILQSTKNIRFCKVIIKISGNNNKITFDDNFCGNDLLIQVNGDNNIIKIGKNVNAGEDLKIYAHENTNNTYTQIGDETTFFKTTIMNTDNNSKIKIGKDCMFAYNTVVKNCDGHYISSNGQNNCGIELTIGNHVWCCEGSTILKNTTIPDGCIVAKGAIVTRKFEEKNCVLGGISAKIIKQNVLWDRRTPNEVINEKQNQSARAQERGRE